MMEPKKIDPSGLLRTSVGLINGEKGRQIVYLRPAGLTLTAQKIDCILTDVQTQIETLRQYKINLGQVRGQLAGMEAKWRGE